MGQHGAAPSFRGVLEAVGAALDSARKLHFTPNFADEYDWPSGHARTTPYQDPELSAVLRAHPEFRMQTLEYSESVLEGSGVWQPLAGATFAVVGRESESGALVADSLTARRCGSAKQCS